MLPRLIAALAFTLATTASAQPYVGPMMNYPALTEAERVRAQAERERAQAERERAQAERERAQSEYFRALAEAQKKGAERQCTTSTLTIGEKSHICTTCCTFNPQQCHTTCQ